MSEVTYLLDQLETADMLLIDDLHAFDFQLNDALLDEAEAAAESNQAFSSDSQVLSIQAQDGRERKTWQFSYNQVMEAKYLSEQDSWLLGEHRLQCLAATLSLGADD